MGPWLPLCVSAALLAAEPPPGPSDGVSQDDPAEIAQEPEGGAGVSPIELIPKVELRQSFLRLDNGASVHETTPEIDIQFLRRVLLRYQTPFRIMQTPNGQISGPGDIEILGLGILASDERYLVGLLAGVVLDTATQPLLGAGKQQVSLGGGAALKPRKWLLGYGIVQEQFSVAGQSARPDVNQLAVRLGGVLFGKQYNWLKLDLDTVVDFPRDAGRLFGTLEVGSLVVGRVGLFMRVGTQLLGQRQIDYVLAGGVRYLFRLEKAKPKAPGTEGMLR